MGKFLGIGLGVIILIPIVLVILFLVLASVVDSTPKNYTQEVKSGGDIEQKYLENGKYEVKSITKDGSDVTNKFYIYYPEEMENSNKKYPVVVMLNGTGVLPKKYKASFNHLASWGFIVIGSDDGSSGFGKSSDETIDLLTSENNNKDSLLYNKIDFDNIGIVGHSQGGAGVFTAVSIMKNKGKYKTAVALSPTFEGSAHNYGWNYDLTKINIPTLMMAGTGGDFETQLVIPIDKMIEMYNKIPSSKVMLRRIGTEHGQMLYSADGYVTAWFMYYLQNDDEAGKAFIGEDAEILNNKLYQDVDKNI